MAGKHSYHSLEDFLTSKMLTVDAEGENGWGGSFPVKGREIEATVLFADISGFSGRTADLDPTETLIFVNHFFSWITEEALRGRPGMVDKYIGDEVMIVYSREFGSEDPFVDAVQAARWMGQYDAFAFCPHIGLASGEVIVGHVGTSLKYDCSVFGAPVAMAARCAKEEVKYEAAPFSSSITFPAADWGDREFSEVLPPERRKGPEGEDYEQEHGWRLLPPREVEFKNLGSTEIQEIINPGMWLPGELPEDRARKSAKLIAKAGRRWDPKVVTEVRE